MVGKEYLKVSEVAKKFGVTPLTVRRWIEKNQLKAVKLGGRWYIEAESLKNLNAKPKQR